MKKELQLFNESWNEMKLAIKELCKTIKGWKSKKMSTLPFEDQEVQKLYDELITHRKHVDFVIDYIEDYIKNGGKCEGFDLRLMEGKTKIEDIKKTLAVCAQYGIDAKDVLLYTTIRITSFKPFFINHLVEKGYAKNATAAKELYEEVLPVVHFDERKSVLRLLTEKEEPKA